MRAPRRSLGALAAGAVLLAGCTAGEPNAGSGGTPSPSSTVSPSAPSSSPSPGPTSSSATPAAPAEPAAGQQAGQQSPPVSVLGLAELRHQGDRLRLGAVRERTAAYTSYDVSYRSRTTGSAGTESYRITGVLNVPRGRGPFPAVVLAHGYIEPAVYVRGQGMTRERGYLASRGYVALHVDYRNHAESDDDRVALLGRSMGGGVILKALVAAPGLVQAAAPWASVSSLEADNYRTFIRPDPEDPGLRARLARRWGTPAENPAFWRRNSSRPYFDRITEPVLMVHGRVDDTCPPRWAAATQRALTRAGVDSRLARYDDRHAFGPAFDAAMDRTVRFFDRRLG